MPDIITLATPLQLEKKNLRDEIFRYYRHLYSKAELWHIALSNFIPNPDKTSLRTVIVRPVS